MTSSRDIPEYCGARLIAENARVRIWADVFEPGVPIGPHRHPHDYIVVALDAGMVTVTALDGAETTHAMAAGDTVFLAVDGPNHAHRAVHHGPRPHREIVIELKEPRV